MELNNLIFVLLFIFFSYFFNKYLIFICKKKKFNFLVDDQFKKPQAFHRHPTLRLGGVALFFLFSIVKAIVPRYRYDQLMRLGWKIFLPFSLLYVVLTASFLFYFDMLPTKNF